MLHTLCYLLLNYLRDWVDFIGTPFDKSKNWSPFFSLLHNSWCFAVSNRLIPPVLSNFSYECCWTAFSRLGCHLTFHHTVLKNGTNSIRYLSMGIQPFLILIRRYIGFNFISMYSKWFFLQLIPSFRLNLLKKLLIFPFLLEKNLLLEVGNEFWEWFQQTIWGTTSKLTLP